MILPALLLAAAAAAAPAPPAPKAPKPPLKVSLKTADGWTLAALYRAPRDGKPVVVLAHGVGSSKSEWDAFAARLERAGVGTLAVDLRGHEESLQGPDGKRAYEDFDADGQWEKAVGDLDAAAAWLAKEKKLPASRIAFGGASIGANLASVAAARRPKTPFLFLLSPGPDYHGVRPLLRPGTPTLVGASRADGYAHQTLGPMATVKGVKTFEAPSGHGVQMFQDKATFDEVVAWVLSRVKAARRH